MSTKPSPMRREFISVEGSDINSTTRPDGTIFFFFSLNPLSDLLNKEFFCCNAVSGVVPHGVSL
jgi:hypothetical protein